MIHYINVKPVTTPLSGQIGSRVTLNHTKMLDNTGANVARRASIGLIFSTVT